MAARGSVGLVNSIVLGGLPIPGARCYDGSRVGNPARHVLYTKQIKGDRGRCNETNKMEDIRGLPWCVR